MWTFERDSPLPLWLAAGVPSVVLAATTRLGGVSAPPYHALNLGRSTDDQPAAVAENRRRALARIGFTPDSLVTAGQVHGTRVVAASEPGHCPECDALVTTTPGLVLAVTTADCMSLLFAAPGGVAASHSGWRGTAEGMPVATLRALCEAARCEPVEVVVAIGPCIRSCCYEVGPEVAERFPAEALTADRPRPHLDLPGAARRVLIEAGVPARSIHDSGACTACEPYWYYSHRRDGPTGRHWGLAGIAAAPGGERP
jgi:YfiH family protein